MRRMIPQKLIDAIKHLAPLANTIEYVGSQVKINADVALEGLTSKGIANTGALANIGNIEATGFIDGQLKDGITMTPIEGVEVRYYVSKRIGNVCFVQFKFFNNTGAAITSSMKIADVSYKPESSINFIGFYSNTSASLRINEQGELRTVNQLAGGTEFGGFIMIGLTNQQP